VLAESDDQEEIIARVAALDIGKAELVCCVRVPAPRGRRKRLQGGLDRAGQSPGGIAGAVGLFLALILLRP
jgi:hypothetical protein